MKSFFFGFFMTILILASLVSGFGSLILFIYACAGKELVLWLELCPLVAALCGGAWFWFDTRD